MGVGELSAPQLRQAIQTFLELAYPDRRVPESRTHYCGLSHELTLENLLSLKGVEKIACGSHGDEMGYALRVGNAWYLHMKLLIQPYKESPGFVFGVDTHDMFRVPADSPDSEQLNIIRARNRELARQIEAAWEAVGLPTHKALLRRYLRECADKRQAEADANQAHPGQDLPTDSNNSPTSSNP